VIPWRPIAEMPEALKDGREVLLGWWERNRGGTANPQPDKWVAAVAEWSRYANLPNDWQLSMTGSYAEDGDLYADPTHFAEIDAPKD